MTGFLFYELKRHINVLSVGVMNLRRNNLLSTLIGAIYHAAIFKLLALLFLCLNIQRVDVVSTHLVQIKKTIIFDIFFSPSHGGG